MTETAIPQPIPIRFFGAIGRATLSPVDGVLVFFGAIGAMWKLLVSGLYYATVAPFTGRSKLRKQLFIIAIDVGVRSAPIVCLVATLVGAILVLQVGPTLQTFGQTRQLPALVALSMTRALGPLMTAIVLISRVGASYTAVIGSMNINEEVTALKTMSINPIGYLIAPRLLALVIMTPCLVVFGFIFGMIGGSAVALSMYQISLEQYLSGSFDQLTANDLIMGVIKCIAFGLVIAIISCHYGLRATGGSVGLGRNIMVSVVTCLVAVVVTDTMLTAFFTNYKVL